MQHSSPGDAGGEWTSPTPFKDVMSRSEFNNSVPPMISTLLSDDEVPAAVDTVESIDTIETSASAVTAAASSGVMRSRKGGSNHGNGFNPHFRRKRRNKHRRHKRALDTEAGQGELGNNVASNSLLSKCCRDGTLRSTLTIMKLLARILLWTSAVASAAAVVWYSNELKNNGTDTHLIAWFSAGAFVLLGFPISIYGIATHLANYNKPDEQCYIVRILWMVPIYSIESWLCLRYKEYAVYIETLRDCYESYVLYCFLQFLIKTLGGEEQLILMLKDKSPTRGVHMWGLQWCVKPWLMGQPIRKIVEAPPPPPTHEAPTPIQTNNNNNHNSALKRVHWTSPFFVQCKFGVLQYVLLKLICSIAIMFLEKYNLYKEGDFTPKGGYLYICILTNTSQCWALYCLIFFYYATKNELSPIRPVGKFLAVKALVFFTWWQSLGIAILYQMDLIPHYHPGTPDLEDKNAIGSYKPMSAEDAMALDDYGGKVLDSQQVLGQEWTSEDVAKGLQDYLICIEMFVAAIIHIFVFPHTEYDPQAVEARARALNQRPNNNWNKRLGRKWKDWDNKSNWSGASTYASSEYEMSYPLKSSSPTPKSASIYKTDSNDEEDDLRIHPMDRITAANERRPLLMLETVESTGELDTDDNVSSSGDDGDYEDEDSEYDSTDEENPPSIENSSAPQRKQGFVSALLDSTIPQDLRDNTVGIIKGDYVVEKKTLLHHAATSDSYDLFSRVPRMKIKRSPPASSSEP
eukprot:scaffold7656_cov104-Cylindrotheca_fusiformis.AAC.2